MTPTQTRIVLESIQHERQQNIYERAKVMMGATSGAIAGAFGKGDGGFDRWVESLKPSDNGDEAQPTVTPIPPRIPSGKGKYIPPSDEPPHGMDGWKEIE